MPIGFTGTWLMETRVDRSMTRLGKNVGLHPARENREPFRLCVRTGGKEAILAAGNAHDAPDLRLKEGHISRNPCITDALIARTTSISGEQR